MLSQKEEFHIHSTRWTLGEKKFKVNAANDSKQ
jgi:hypothetical protein